MLNIFYQMSPLFQIDGREGFLYHFINQVSDD